MTNKKDSIMKIDSSLDNIYIDKLKGVNFNPVFILGLHRSGTSILYKMLNGTNRFNVVKAYHIFNYNELIYNHINNLEEKEKEELNTLFKNKGIINRKTDLLEVTPDYTQEYWFIFPETDFTPKLKNKNKLLFETLCKKIKYISKNDKPILLKNPYDFTNFLFIKKIYPNAKFIFIHRHPLHVLSSLSRAWKTLLNKKSEFLAIFSKKYNQIFENPILLFTHRIYYIGPFHTGLIGAIYRYSMSTKYFLRNINRIKDEDYISIKYEDLCQDPNGVISNILDFLELNSNEDFSKFIQPRNLDLSFEVKKLKKIILKKMKPYIDHFEYK